MAELRLRNLRKAYGAIEVVHGVDLHASDGSFVVLVGPSGCGKSTILRMIAGLEEVTSGEMTFDDEDVRDLTPKERNVAMVFQDYALYPHMTVEKNIGFGLSLSGVSRAERGEAVRRTAEMLQIEHLLDRKPRALSGGQRQRVAIGRAMVRSPSVFLFDEPLSNLDAKLRTEMRAQIKRLHKQLGVTSVYVTHDQLEAMTLADQIVCLKDGHVAQAGTPRELYARPSSIFVAEFIGSPAMNLVPGLLLHDGQGPKIEIAGQVITAPQALAERPPGLVTVGLRPEHAGDLPILGGQTLRVTIDLLEPIGSEILLTTQLGDHPFTIRCEDRGQFNAGAELTAHFSLANLHLFDPESGLRIDTSAVTETTA